MLNCFKCFGFALALLSSPIMLSAAESLPPSESATNSTEVESSVGTLQGGINTTQFIYKLQRSRNPIEIVKASEFIYSSEDTALIMLGGVRYGTLKFNFSQLLGIWDWYNADAVNEGIEHSYTMNFNVDMSPLLQSVDLSAIDLEVNILNKDGKKISAPCMVGWSGFPERLDLYSGDTSSGNLEVGIQPIVKSIPGSAYLEVNIYDSTNHLDFDPIYYDLSLLKNATKGPSLLHVDETIDVQSINGATYSIVFTKAEHNVRYTDTSYSEVELYDIHYAIKYLEAPSNDRVVSIFDSFDGNKICPRLTFGVQSDNDASILKTVIGSALEETDRHKRYRYVTTTQSFDVGSGYKYKTNRSIPDGVLPATNYVRIIVEFPEESASRAEAEMAEFSGRYVVYQLKLSEYETPKHSEVFGEE